MDAAPSNEIVQKVRELASSVPLVKDVQKCYVRKMGFDYYVDIHIEVAGHLSVTEGHKIAHEVKDKILKKQFKSYECIGSCRALLKTQLLFYPIIL